MTRDDAIKIFNTVLCLGKCDCSKDEIEECLKMAIKALQEHQYYKDLAESYEKTINKLTKVIAEQQLKTEGARGDIPLQQTIPEMPQTKKGHWIGDKGATVYVNSEGNVTESVNCSECGEWLTGSDEYVCGARYCPSCGIKMQEVKK